MNLLVGDFEEILLQYSTLKLFIGERNLSLKVFVLLNKKF
jgi:hypothetical protein